MKKTFVVLACFAIFAGSLFAQEKTDAKEWSAPKAVREIDDDQFEEEKTQTLLIVPKEQHTVDKNANVRIEYNPLYDEVRIYYETLYVTFDKGEAMNTVMAVMEDFMLDHQYFHYRYMKKDRERHFKDDRGIRKTEYSSYLKLTRQFPVRFAIQVQKGILS